MFDDEKPQKKPAYIVGQAIAETSVAELDQLIALLHEEILRLEAERNKKAGVLDAASALFRK